MLSKKAFRRLCLWAIIFLFVSKGNSQQSYPTGIPFSGGAYEYAMAGSERGFHVVVKQGNNIVYYLLDYEGNPIPAYTHTIAANVSADAHPTITASQDTVHIIYRNGNQIEIWQNNQGGEGVWEQKNRVDTGAPSTNRISAERTPGYVHVTWDEGKDENGEVYFASFHITLNVWQFFKNITDQSPSPEGSHPTIHAYQDSNDWKIHVYYSGIDNSVQSAKKPPDIEGRV